MDFASTPKTAEHEAHAVEQDLRKVSEEERKAKKRELLKVLQEQLRVQESKSSEDKGNETDLHRAARRGNLALVRSLLANGAIVDRPNLQDHTPLHESAKQGFQRFWGASSGSARQGTLPTPMSSAKVAEALLAHGADVDRADLTGRTALHFAACREDVAVLKALLAHGADVDRADLTGRTPLHFAACREDVAGLKLLLKYGADLHSTASDGNTPLHDAASRYVQRAVLVLWDAGADPLRENLRGYTPLSLLPPLSRVAKRMIFRTTPLRRLWFEAQTSKLTRTLLLAALQSHYIICFSDFLLAHHLLLFAIRQGVLEHSQLAAFGTTPNYILHNVYLPAANLPLTAHQIFWWRRIVLYAGSINLIESNELLSLHQGPHIQADHRTFHALIDEMRLISYHYQGIHGMQHLKRDTALSPVLYRLEFHRWSKHERNIDKARFGMIQLFYHLENKSDQKHWITAALLSFVTAIIPILSEALCRAVFTTSRGGFEYTIERELEIDPAAIVELLAVDLSDLRTAVLLTSNLCLTKLPPKYRFCLETVVSYTPFQTLANLQHQLSNAILNVDDSNIFLEHQRTYSCHYLCQLLNHTSLTYPQFDLKAKLSTLPYLRLSPSPVFRNWLASNLNRPTTADPGLSTTSKQNLAAAMVYWASVTFAHTKRPEDTHFRVLLLYAALKVFRECEGLSVEADFGLTLLAKVLSNDLNLLHEHLILLEDRELITKVGDHFPSLLHSLGTKEKERVQNAWKLVLLMQIISLGHGLTLDEEDFSLISELYDAATFPLWDLEKQLQDHGICVKPIPNPELQSSTDTYHLSLSNDRNTLLIRLEPQKLSAVGFSIFSHALVSIDHNSEVLKAVMREMRSFRNCFISEFRGEDDECVSGNRTGLCSSLITTWISLLY
eukprot:TRINITY_DN1227_c0_g1_i1.p1 TRINITY_DN1227_c0_g1~~TRINITY_DN1227_c0_g1_i1.p1  ORF type:complete len:898 (+),score=82.90 TRINITY_DN1227_c0_g1_i1:1138-3831(+)